MTKDITNKVFDRLTAIRHYGKDKNGAALWVWKCSCGTEKVLATYRVKTGNDRSCGCLQRESARERGVKSLGRNGNSAKNEAVNIYVRTAKHRGHEWSLTREYAEKLLVSNCHYCGAAPSRINENGSGIFVHGGIDRIDSDKGYVVSNVVPACFTCNAMKLDHSLAFFKEHLARIITHMGLGENL